MKVRNTACLLGLVLCLAVSAVGVASAEEEAAIVEQHGQWEISYGAVYYRVFGYVQNKSAKPVHYIKLQLDLVPAELNYSIIISQETAPAFRKWMYEA